MTDELPYPAFQEGVSLITFAKDEDFEGRLGPGLYIAKASEPLRVRELLEDRECQFGKHLFRLMRLPWEGFRQSEFAAAHLVENLFRIFFCDLGNYLSTVL